MLTFITIFLLPVFYIYMYTGNKNTTSFVKSTFLGNLGGAHAMCMHKQLHFTQLDLECQEGMVLDTNYAKFGVISNQFEYFGYCLEEQIDSEVKEFGYESCTSHLNSDIVHKIKHNLKENCDLKESCDVDFGGIMEGNDGNENVAKFCDREAYFYIQAPCVNPSNKITPTMLKGLIISCITVLIIIFSINYIQYIESV